MIVELAIYDPETGLVIRHTLCSGTLIRDKVQRIIDVPFGGDVVLMGYEVDGTSLQDCVKQTDVVAMRIDKHSYITNLRDHGPGEPVSKLLIHATLHEEKDYG